jgi:hypothetical protein
VNFGRRKAHLRKYDSWIVCVKNGSEKRKEKKKIGKESDVQGVKKGQWTAMRLLSHKRRERFLKTDYHLCDNRGKCLKNNQIGK